MALSNIFNEPRREIIESAIGIAFSVVLCWGLWQIIYPLAERIQKTDTTMPFAVAVLIAILTLMVLFSIVLGSMALTHAIGDGICNFFQRRGIYLRPRTRRRTNGYTYTE